MSKRHREDFHTPHLIPERLLAPLSVKKPSRILVNFMGDLFGDWVDPNMKVLQYFEPVKAGGRTITEFDGTLKSGIFDVIRLCPQHTFIFLTKDPKNIEQWGRFPDNAWVGASACDSDSWDNAFCNLKEVDAKHKWLSFEPLYELLPMEETDLDGISWVVIGQQTPVKPETTPKIEWIKEIVEAADKARIPVFLKNNMESLIESQCNMNDQWAAREWVQCKYPVLRQEFPGVKVRA
jgi:protein gp37